MSKTNKIIKSSVPAKSISLVTAPYRYVKSTISNWAPVFITHQMYNIITKVETPRRFALHFTSQILLSLGSNYASLLLLQNVNDGFSPIGSYIFKTLAEKEASDADLESFINSIYAVTTPLMTLVVFNMASSYVLTRYQNWYQRSLVDKLSNIIWLNQSSVELVNAPQTDHIVRTIREDIYTFSQSGVNLVLSFGNGIQSFLFSICGLIAYSSPIRFLFNIPDFLAISIAYSLITNKISSFFTNKIAKLEKEETILAIRNESILSNDYSNIKPIFSSGTQLPTADRHQNLRDTIRKTSDRRTIWSNAHATWTSCHEYLNMLYKNLVLGIKVFYKQIASDKIQTSWMHFAHVDNFISWSSTNQKPVQDFKNITQRLQMFFDAKAKVESRPTGVKYQQGKKEDLKLANLRLEIANSEDPLAAPRLLLDIKEQTFIAGRRYVISGESGSGKSSLLAKINRSLHDGITATGTITFPATCYGNKRMMLTQDDHFSLCSSLLSYLQMPYNIHELPAEERMRIEMTTSEKAAFIAKSKALLREAKIDSPHGPGGLIDRLEEENPNWKATLSGGQRKKLKLVWAILNQPELLLLDEVFAGLDPASIQIIQSMLVKYLPNTLIIAVEHKPGSLNNNIKRADGTEQPFFQEELAVYDSRLTNVAASGLTHSSSAPRARQTSFAAQYAPSPRTRGFHGPEAAGAGSSFVRTLDSSRKRVSKEIDLH